MIEDAGEGFLFEKRNPPPAPSPKKTICGFRYFGSFAAFRWSESHKGWRLFFVLGLGNGVRAVATMMLRAGVWQYLIKMEGF